NGIQNLNLSLVLTFVLPISVIRDLWTGKSVALKTIASHTLDRGARLVAVDHSDNQEWAALARTLTTANFIDFLEPNQSLDPLRIWDTPAKKKRHTLALITMMRSEEHTSE